jgi:hypothetical protein
VEVVAVSSGNESDAAAIALTPWVLHFIDAMPENSITAVCSTMRH